MNQPITINTLHGKLLINRNIDYCAKCGKTFGQNDTALDIQGSGHRATRDYIETVTYVAQMTTSFANAQEMLLKLLNIEISIPQIQKISEEIGKKVFEQNIEEAHTAYLEPEKAAPVALEKDKKDVTLYILTDGSAVNTRIEDVNGSTWKEMKLGLTFLDRDVIKRKNDDGIITKKEYVAYFGGVDEFKKLIFTSAARAGYGRVKRVVVIGDGAHWIWNICKELFPDAECILDFFHMAENVHDYAKALFPTDEKKCKKWAHTIIHYIKTEQIKKAYKKIAASQLPSTAPESVVNLAGYLQNNEKRMKYLTYKNKGYYIGSGMIESGNKVVVQKRMKQAGMRWSVNGGQYMVALRAKHESKNWEDVKRVIFTAQNMAA